MVAPAGRRARPAPPGSRAVPPVCGQCRQHPRIRGVLTCRRSRSRSARADEPPVPACLRRGITQDQREDGPPRVPRRNRS